LDASRDVAVAGDRGAEVTGRVVPDAVFGAFAQEQAAIVGEVTLEPTAARAAARSIVIGSTCPPPIGGRLLSWRYETIISWAASISISRVSSTVRPHVTTAGHSAS